MLFVHACNCEHRSSCHAKSPESTQECIQSSMTACASQTRIADVQTSMIIDDYAHMRHGRVCASVLQRSDRLCCGIRCLFRKSPTWQCLGQVQAFWMVAYLGWQRCTCMGWRQRSGKLERWGRFVWCRHRGMIQRTGCIHHTTSQLHFQLATPWNEFTSTV